MALTNRIKLTTNLDKDLHKQLKELSEQTRIPMSKLFDESIELLLKQHNKSK